MKIKSGLFYLVLFAVIACLFSCVTGQYMSLSKNENAEILGTVSTVFRVTGSFRYKKVINTQAYMSLLAEAQKVYPGNIDVKDITWVIGEGDSENNNYRYTAVGKVIRN